MCNLIAQQYPKKIDIVAINSLAQYYFVSNLNLIAAFVIVIIIITVMCNITKGENSL